MKNKSKRKASAKKAVTKEVLKVFGKGPDEKLNKIEKAYKNNYVKINTRGGTTTGPKKPSKKEFTQFKNRVDATREAYDIESKEAIKKVLNTEAYTNPAERSRKNLLDTIKSDFEDTYNEIRNKIHSGTGKWISDKELMNKMTWDKDRRAYTVTSGGMTYMIDSSNSPEEVVFVAI